MADQDSPAFRKLQARVRAAHAAAAAAAPATIVSTACPHCDKGTLVDHSADGVITDTAGVDVHVWECDTCDYTEGRPVEQPAPV